MAERKFITLKVTLLELKMIMEALESYSNYTEDYLYKELSDELKILLEKGKNDA